MAKNDEHDDADELLDALKPPAVEPPPMSPPPVPPPYSSPIPFGAPPAEPVTLVPGEIPWELREDESAVEHVEPEK